MTPDGGQRPQQAGQLAPEIRGKVYMLDKWLDGNDIPDPYRQQRIAFEHVHEMITKGVDSWQIYL